MQAWLFAVLVSVFSFSLFAQARTATIISFAEKSGEITWQRNDEIFGQRKLSPLIYKDLAKRAKAMWPKDLKAKSRCLGSLEIRFDLNPKSKNNLAPICLESLPEKESESIGTWLHDVRKWLGIPDGI